MYRARIEVSLKPGHSDPEGEMTAQSLRELKFSVQKANVSKVYVVVFEAQSKKKLKRWWMKCAENFLQTQQKTTTASKLRKKNEPLRQKRRAL